MIRIMTTRRRFFNLLLLAVRPPKSASAAITPAYLRAVRASDAAVRDYRPRPALTFNRLPPRVEQLVEEIHREHREQFRRLRGEVGAIESLLGRA